MDSTTIAARVTGLDHGNIPPEVWEHAGVALLHDLAVAVAAAGRLKPLTRWIATAAPGPARLINTPETLSTADAAFANATMMHARAQDDVHFPSQSHAGAVVLPALLAVGERENASGRSLLTSLVAGYEAVGLAGAGIANRSTARGVRATPVYGTLAAAAATAHLLGLDGLGVRDAIGLAASIVGSTSQTWVSGSPEWRYQAGFASRSAVTAAELAACGATAAVDSLEGPAGLYRVVTNDPPNADSGAADSTDEGWATLEVSFKPYPVCAINQGPVHALLGLVQRESLHADQVEQVTLRLHPDEHAYPGTDDPGPFSDTGGALMSAQFCLAAALHHGPLELRHIEAFDDPTVLRTAARVRVLASTDIAPRTCHVGVETAAGTWLETAFVDDSPFRFDRTAAEDLARRLCAEASVAETGTEQFLQIAAEFEERTVRELMDVVSSLHDTSDTSTSTRSRG